MGFGWRGIFARNSQININSMWFEGFGGAIELASNARVHIENSRFANAGDGSKLQVASPGNGWILKQGTNTHLSWGEGNYIIGTYDNILEPTSNLGLTDGLTYKTSSKTSNGKINVANPSTHTIDGSGLIQIGSKRDVWVTSNATATITLDDISSNLGPGETVSIYAWSEAITISTSGNIRLPDTRTSITVGNDCVAVLRRTHGYGGKEWLLVSVTDEWNTAAPSSGKYYALGTKIWNTAVAAGGSPGWVCTTAGLAGSTAVFKAMANVAA